MVTEKIQIGVDYLVQMIVGLREIIAKGLLALNLPQQSSMTLLFLAVSVILGYYWLRQFVATGLFKLSTMLNWLLLTALFFLVFTRLGG